MAKRQFTVELEVSDNYNLTFLSEDIADAIVAHNEKFSTPVTEVSVSFDLYGHSIKSITLEV